MKLNAAGENYFRNVWNKKRKYVPTEEDGSPRENVQWLERWRWEAGETVERETELRNTLEQYTRKDNIKIINFPNDSDTETADDTEKKV